MPGMDLDGRVMILTGAAGGFGRVLASAFLDAGARVACYDVSRQGLDALAASLAESHHPSRFLTGVCDVADHAACEAAVAGARERLGGLHVLINNAAMGMGVIGTIGANEDIGITVAIDVPSSGY